VSCLNTLPNVNLCFVSYSYNRGSQYSAKTFDKAMKDTLAMERLQHSDYILKIYGNCGSSQLLEAATHGTLKDQIVLAKMADHKEPDGLLNDASNNLRVFYHLAKALADVHRGVDDDDDDSVTFTHNDIDCEQYIFIDGVFKLNDFHYASHELKNRSTGLGCKQEGVKWSTPVSCLFYDLCFRRCHYHPVYSFNRVAIFLFAQLAY